MKKVVLSAFVAVAMLAVFAQGNAGVTKPGFQTNRAIAAALAKHQQRLPSGRAVPSVSGAMVASYLEARQAAKGGANAASGPVISPNTDGCENTFVGPVPNVRANQDCSLRRQAEEQIGVNPADPTNVIVGQNDSRIGFNQTGVDFSIDGGQHFGDYLPPTRFLDYQGIGQDAFSDPAFTIDANGNMYYTAVGFDLNTLATGIYVWKANAADKGSFLHSPSSVSELSSNPVAAHTNDGAQNLSDDKELMTSDNTGGQFSGNVYITWTIFDFHCGQSGDGYCSSPIFFSRSSDGGQNWTTAKEISGNSPNCNFGNFFDPNRDPHDCDFDQFSQPIVGPDGTIYVVFNNANTPTIVAQQMMVKSIDGGDNWSAPVRISSDFDTQPVQTGSLPNGCPPFRQCLPPNGYRMNDGPSIGIDNSTGKLAVFWADFRNGCNPQFSKIKNKCDVNNTPNSNNDVFVSLSTDGGTTWTHAKLVSSVSGARGAPSDPAAQWQPWGDVGEDGTLYAAYYDRKYGTCEADGCNDITLATSHNSGGTWSFTRVTTGSMPNLVPANNPNQAGFLGDYMWTEAAAGNVYIAWADTRGRVGSANPTPEEDVYTAILSQQTL